jgi:hypothetical protein
MGAGPLNGKRPYLVSFSKSRRQDEEFNLLVLALTFNSKLTKE